MRLLYNFDCFINKTQRTAINLFTVHLSNVKKGFWGEIMVLKQSFPPPCNSFRALVGGCLSTSEPSSCTETILPQYPWRHSKAWSSSSPSQTDAISSLFSSRRYKVWNCSSSPLNETIRSRFYLRRSSTWISSAFPRTDTICSPFRPRRSSTWISFSSSRAVAIRSRFRSHPFTA